jgi:hypothetical protein
MLTRWSGTVALARRRLSSHEPPHPAPTPPSETFELAFGGLNRSHTITLGFYEDGALGEVFINGGKSGEAVEAIARDGAVNPVSRLRQRAWRQPDNLSSP